MAQSAKSRIFLVTRLALYSVELSDTVHFRPCDLIFLLTAMCYGVACSDTVFKVFVVGMTMTNILKDRFFAVHISISFPADTNAFLFMLLKKLFRHANSITIIVKCEQLCATRGRKLLQTFLLICCWFSFRHLSQSVHYMQEIFFTSGTWDIIYRSRNCEKLFCSCESCFSP